MTKNMDRKTELAARTGTAGAERAARQNGQKTVAAPPPWYAAQPAERGVAYALTGGGYVVL